MSRLSSRAEHLKHPASERPARRSSTHSTLALAARPSKFKALTTLHRWTSRPRAHGIVDAANKIEAIAASCANTQIVLGGYSQGAAVAGYTTTDTIPDGIVLPDGLAGTLPPAIASHVAAVVLFGTPSDGVPESGRHTTHRPSPSVISTQPRPSSCAHQETPSASPTAVTARPTVPTRATEWPTRPPISRCTRFPPASEIPRAIRRVLLTTRQFE